MALIKDTQALAGGMRTEFTETRNSKDQNSGLPGWLPAAPTARGSPCGSSADQFCTPYGSHKPLHTMIIEVDRGTIRVRFGDNADPVLFVTDCLTFR